MFSSAQRLVERTGQKGTPRRQYLQELVDEFQTTRDQAAKLQVLCHLANFAYDPINYVHLRDLGVISLFLDCLGDGNEDPRFVEFAMAGLSNLALDKANKDVIAQEDGIPAIIQGLRSSNDHVVLSSLVTLDFLVSPFNAQQIKTPDVHAQISALQMAANPRVRMMAAVVLSNHFAVETASG